MTLRVMEWNLNQRLNYAKSNMPDWIADVIVESGADLIALTEVYTGNNWQQIKEKAFPAHYPVFETSNQHVGQNDVVIAVNGNRLDVLHSQSFVPDRAGIPDHLEIKCRDKVTGTEFLFACIRIHASVSDAQKIREFTYILDATKDEKAVILCGDFNNNRRGFQAADRWNLLTMDKMIRPYSLLRSTPPGSSIYGESRGNPDYEFAEDHFLTKGIGSMERVAYDRSFVIRDKTAYKWGKDFQIYLGKDIYGKNIYESVSPPFPDHAILSGVIQLN